MPTYRYRCQTCNNEFNALRDVGSRDEPAKCAQCNADALRIPAVACVQVTDGDLQKSFLYRAGKAMYKAKSERAAHEERFGNYNEYAQSKPKPDQEPSDEPIKVDRLGNVTGPDADAAFNA